MAKGIRGRLQGLVALALLMTAGALLSQPAVAQRRMPCLDVEAAYLLHRAAPLGIADAAAAKWAVIDY